MNLSKQDIAQELGQPPSWVSMRLGLLQASSKIKKLIENRQIEDFRTIHELRKLEEEKPEAAFNIINKIEKKELRGSYRTNIKQAREAQSNYTQNTDTNTHTGEITNFKYNKKTQTLEIARTPSSSSNANIKLKISPNKLKEFLQNTLNKL